MQLTQTNKHIDQNSKAFSTHEREKLLAVHGVGPTVVKRFEQLGIASLAQLAAADSGDILLGVSEMLHASCWRNSPQAKRAVEAAIAMAKSAL